MWQHTKSWTQQSHLQMLSSRKNYQPTGGVPLPHFSCGAAADPLVSPMWFCLAPISGSAGAAGLLFCTVHHDGGGLLPADTISYLPLGAALEPASLPRVSSQPGEVCVWGILANHLAWPGLCPMRHWPALTSILRCPDQSSG